MKRNIAVGLCLVLIVGVGRHAFGAASADAKQTSEHQQVVTKVIDGLLAASEAAGLSEDVEAEQFLAVTVTNRSGEEMVLEFEADPADSTWRPILPEETAQGIFGRQFFGFGPSDLIRLKGRADPAKRAQLLPFSAEVAEQPHDDVSVFIVNRNLVLISFWLAGEQLGTYYALNAEAMAIPSDASEDGSGDDPLSVEGTTDKRGIVCYSLYEGCIAQESEWWWAMCGLWLYFCSAS